MISRPNLAAPVDALIARLFHAVSLWRRATEQHRWTK